MYYYLAALVVISYVLMQSIETISFGSRVASKICKKLSLGTTLQHSIFTGSRMFLVPLLLSLAFLIESGIQMQTYLIMVIISTVFSFFISATVLYKLNFFQKFFQNFFFFYEGSTIPVAIFKSIVTRDNVPVINCTYKVNLPDLIWKKVFVSSVSYLFLSTGFFFAFMLSVLYPEYRLTLGQLSTAFHGIGAILLAFYIDPMLSRSIDSVADDETWIVNINSIIFGRITAYLLSSTIFIFVGFVYI